MPAFLATTPLVYARMRQWDQERAAERGAGPRSTDGVAQRRPAPQAVDGERADQQHDRGVHERELALEPWSAERDLRRRRPAIPRPAARLAGEALRDRGAIRQLVRPDAGAGKPPPELGSRAAGERRPRRELHDPRRLADD